MSDPMSLQAALYLSGEPFTSHGCMAAQEGDVLYMPRGTIHQAVAQSQDSIHLTISTYQRWTHGDLTARLLSSALASTDSSAAAPLPLRQGLPWDCLTAAGVGGDGKVAKRRDQVRQACEWTVAGEL